MTRNRSHKKTRGDRKKQSEQVQNELVSLIRNDNLISAELKNNALEKLISLNRKHRLKMPKEISLIYCKQCKLLYDSTNMRVRINTGNLLFLAWNAITYEGSAVVPNLIGEIQMSEIPKNIKKLALSRDLKATIRIGKSGITENLIAEISDQLSTKSIVKIKINRGLFDKSDLKNLWLHLKSPPIQD